MQRFAPRRCASPSCPRRRLWRAASASPATGQCDVSAAMRHQLSACLIVGRQLGSINERIAADVRPHARPEACHALAARDDGVRGKGGRVLPRNAARCGVRGENAFRTRCGARALLAACPQTACALSPDPSGSPEKLRERLPDNRETISLVRSAARTCVPVASPAAILCARLTSPTWSLPTMRRFTGS